MSRAGACGGLGARVHPADVPGQRGSAALSIDGAASRGMEAERPSTLILNSSFTMGSLSQNIYVANNMGQDAYVMACLTEEWQIIDGVVGAAELIAACVDVAALPEAVAEFGAEMPAEISTFGELARFLKATAKFANSARKATVGFESKISNLVRTFHRNSVHIPAGQFQNVSDISISSILTPSTIAAFSGADTIRLIVMSGDGKFQASFDSGADHSWVLNYGQYIVRARYGKIWQQDPEAGQHAWHVFPPRILLDVYEPALAELQRMLPVLQERERQGLPPMFPTLSVSWLEQMIAMQKSIINPLRASAGLPPLP